MLTQHTIKSLQSLSKKKFRQKYNLFLVEGNKTIKELTKSSFKIKEIYSIEPHNIEINNVPVYQITDSELKKISLLQNPKDSLAVCYMNKEELDINVNQRLILDEIQDPGNMGTIIRLADWFGIEEIVCSKGTVDFYNPKVIQASMGSFTRVNIVYTELAEFLGNDNKVSLATDMHGDNIYSIDFPKEFNLILGNEGNGVSEVIKKMADQTISIPRFGKNKCTESLNVAMATGIILGQIFSKK